MKTPSKSLVDLVGVMFGALVVESRAASAPDGSARWNCTCECGAQRTINGTALRAGRHKSCGCKSPRFARKCDGLSGKHGMSTSKTYRIWAGMHQRCRNPRAKKAHLYFAKGIRVCARWSAFELFLEDMGECPDGMTIERKDGLQGYSPENCRWATTKEQANNTTRNKRITYCGETLTISNWAERLGLKTNTLVYRLKRGWAIDRALVAGKTVRNPLATQRL